jgi:hypothetical protein
VSATEVQRLADERGLTWDDLAEALRALPDPPGTRLSSTEADVLRRLGIDPTESSRGPHLLGVLQRRRVEASSLTVSEAADLLDRDASRVRQRLAGPNRSLLGFHRRSGQRDWLLPRFQFALGLHDLDGWARLLQALPQADDSSPVALVAWLTTSRPHLGGRSRAQALADGYDVDVLTAEAASFGMPA